MATYFKYAERNVDSQVNWAEIGKNMTDMLQEEGRIRQEKKAAIDEASREFGKTLSDAPTGDFDAGNTFALNHANNAQELRLIQDTLLKSGQLSVRDYTIARQNINDGTGQIFDLAKEYQAEYSDKMARWDADESSFREVWEMEQAEGLSNLTNVNSYINPTNGVVSIGKMVKGKDGVMVMSTNENDFSTVSDLKRRLKQKYDRFDVDGYAVEAAEQLGEVVDTTVLPGVEGGIDQIIKRVDAKKGDYTDAEKEFVASYKDYEDDKVEAAKVNPNDVASVLTDAKRKAPNGKTYTFTYNKGDVENEDGTRKEDTDHLVFIDRSENPAGTVKATEEQEKVVDDLIRTKIRAAIDVKKETNVSRRGYKPSGAASGAAKEKAQIDIMSNIGALYYGDDNEVNTALSALRGFNSNIVETDRTGDGGVVITYADGTSETISFRDANGQVMSQKQFIEAAANKLLRGNEQGYVISDYDEIARLGKLDLTRDFNEASKGHDELQKPTKMPFEETFMSHEGAKLDMTAFRTGSGISETEEKAMANEVSTFVSGLPGMQGATARVFGYGRGIKVKDAKGNVIAEIDLEDADVNALENFKQTILNKAFSVYDILLQGNEEAKEKYVEDYGKSNTTSGGAGSASGAGL